LSAPGESTADAVKHNATGFIRGAEQGATLGLADELGALGQAQLQGLADLAPKGALEWAGIENRYGPGDLLDTYRQARGENRQLYKEAEAAAPNANFAGQLAGSLAIPLPGGAARTLSKTALQGVALGAGTAAGAGEADLTKGEFGQFAAEVGTGGVLGAGLGAGGHFLGKTLAKGGEKVRGFAGRKLEALLQRNQDDAAREASKLTMSARAEAGHAAQDAYRQTEHLRDLGRQGRLTQEQQAAFNRLSDELGAKAQEKLVPAAQRKADAAAAFKDLLASEPERAAQIAKDKLSTGELKRQTLARLKRYGLPALGGYVGSQVFDDNSGLGAGAGALAGAGLRPMMHSLLRMSRQPVVQQRVLGGLRALGSTTEVAGQATASGLRRVPPALPRLVISDDLRPLFADKDEERLKELQEILAAGR